MTRVLVIAFGLLLLTLATFVFASAHMNQGWWGPGMMGGWSRHHYAMMGGIPAPYTAAQNPLPLNETTLNRGAAVYVKNCASCHGDSGHGDGSAGAALRPPPADLAWISAMPMSRWDAYMVWTVSEGGTPFRTAMPEFKGTLSDAEIWSVIAYIQNKLPSETRSGKPYGPHTPRWRCCY